MKNRSMIIALCSAVIVMLAGCGKQPAAEGSGGSVSAAAGEIGLDAAKTAALKHAGVSESDAEFTKAKLDYDDGNAEYEIEFTANSKRYEYEISAADGEVLEFSVKNSGGSQTSGQSAESGMISESEAKQAALAHAGFSEDQVTFTKFELDHDDGMTKYEIEFTVNGVEYEFEIDANTGDILKTEVDSR